MDNNTDAGILGQICENKRLEVARQKEAMPLSYMMNFLDVTDHQTISFKQALTNSHSGIIAEFKRRSPSKGWIHADADIKSIVVGYEQAGATAISILTDEKFFGGTFHDFHRARKRIKQIPLLRKDFIVDEYQVYQSKVMGADVILLIAACLTKEETFRFTEIAHELNMEVLLEIHNEEELAYIQPNVDVVGINNRDLKTFVTDIRHTIDLANRIPDSYVKISESGLSKPETVIQLRQAGFKGFLMGENFMKNEAPDVALEKFISELNTENKPKLKVCGMLYPENIKALATLSIDMLGLIFYEKSPRYAGNLDTEVLKIIPPDISKIGVFVNASQADILEKVAKFDLQAVQLHGDESPDFCRELQAQNIKIIKAFQILKAEDFEPCASYKNVCDYFLFDTKTSQYGGSGKKFDWHILSSYKGDTFFFLSGGIGEDDAETIRQLRHPLLYAIDLNSRFEIEPGLKDIGKITAFIECRD
jgi:indole-3-glycerol phosphate synthase